MTREQVTKLLHRAVGKVRTEEFHLFQHRIGAALQREEERHFVGAELVNHQEGVFAVLFSNVVDIAVHVFTRDRQIVERRQNMATDRCQHLGLVGANVKHLLVFSASKVSRRTAKTASFPAQPEDSNRRSGSAL